MRWALLLVLVAGCPTPGGDDAPDDAPPDEDAGLTLQWSSRPESIPGPASSNIDLERVVLRLRDLRVIGDAGPGDPRTFRERLTVEWTAGLTPRDEDFADAPAGLYSRIVFELGGGDELYAYEIMGTVDLDGSSVPFTIRDREARPLSIDCALTLPPGGETSVTVNVDLTQIVERVDYDLLPTVDGRRVLETGDPQMAAIRAEIDAAFTTPSAVRLD